MKKIAMLGPNLESKGGVNITINHLKNEFLKNNIEVHLFPIGKTKLKNSEYIHPINSNKKKEQLSILKKEIKKYNFDLIIANNLRTGYILSQINLNKSIYIIHQGKILQKTNFYVKIKQKFYFKKIFNNKNLIFLNKCFKNEFLKKFTNLKINYKVIPNLFDFKEIIKKSNEKKIEKNYIIGVGRLDKNKNFDYLIKAYALSNIKEELWLLGDGEELKNLQLLAKKLNIENKIKFLGWKKNPYPYIKNAKLLVHPSKFESFGNIIVEALILNTPVVATNIKCGPSDILVNEFSEFLVPLHKEQELAKKIKKALQNYPIITNKLLEKYKSENVIKEYMKFL